MRLHLSMLLVGMVVLGLSQASADVRESMVGQDGSKMLLVPAGQFTMGTGEDRPDATPPHRLELPAFYIDEKEVTTEQYARFVKETGTTPPPDWIDNAPPAGRENLPMTNITWYDAMRYAIWAGKRLPTEAEWEKAARGTDGRQYPWGNTMEADRTAMPTPNTSSTFHGVVEVGSFPLGASAYGCLDMSGNAWEWTADWYDRYPGSDAASVHFGKQYKVIRGGGALGFYGQPNAGTCVQRGRIVPYGAYDSLGFRCVKDLDGATPPYEPARLLEEAETQLQASLREPVQLPYEKRFEQYKAAGRVPIEVVGMAGRTGTVRTGFPLPKGMVKDVASIGLLDASGSAVGVQASVSSRWEDGSVRWALLTFKGRAGESYTVDPRGTAAGGTGLAVTPLNVTQSDDAVTVSTNDVVVDVTADALMRSIRSKADKLALGAFVCEMRAEAADGTVETWHAMAAEKIELEESGPLYAVVRLQGLMGDPSGKPTPFRYDLRIHVNANAPRVNALLTLRHHAARDYPLEKRTPVVQVHEVRAGFELSEAPGGYRFGTDRDPYDVPAAQPAELLQPDDLQYAIGQPGQRLAAHPATPVNVPPVYVGEAVVPEEQLEVPPPTDGSTGTRAPGWVALQTDAGEIVFGVRHFWQNCPKALLAAPDAVAARLYAGDGPFEWEAGLAKTHEIVIELRPQRAAGKAVALDPLRATMPPAWACGTEAFGAIIPRTSEVLERFPYWEAMREKAMWQWFNAMPKTFRDFGDGYLGGPWKGKNAYVDLEYDVPLNFMFSFLRTGQPWYLEAAEAMARHQADVDIDNFVGRQWKHSPLHTTTEADFGHVFVRGMLLHHLITGERRSLEMAMKVGDWVAPIVSRGERLGNERKIGWSLYALTGLYEVTREQRYLDAAEAMCRLLIDGQAPTGKFDIRWDNRIAFFNGIAMNGMTTLHGLTGDDELARCILRCAGRTLGFYPEYACRTLNAFCWALEETHDPRYLDGLHRVWNSSLEFLLDRTIETEDTHSWRFPRFAARYRMFSMFDGDVPPLPDPATWRSTRFESPEATVYLRPVDEKSASVLVIREGLASGRVELLDGRGTIVRSADLDDTSKYFQAAALQLPPGDTYLLRTTSGEAYGWQVQHDAHSRMIVYDPTGERLHDLMPRVFGRLREDVKQVKVELEATGEGFHSAMLYDPQGRPVSAVRHFIDFGDPGRYVMELNGWARGGREGWSLELVNVKVLSIDGFLPYYACSPDDLFNPER